MNVIKKGSDGYMVHRESGMTGSGPSWGRTLNVALGRHYGGDRRRIPVADQDRVALLYREACTVQDASASSTHP